MVFRFQALPIVEMSTASTSYKEGEFGMTQYDTPFHFWVRLGMAMASSRVGVTQKTSWLQGHSACCNTDFSTHWKQGSDGVTWQQQQLCPVSHNMRWTASHKCQSQHAYTRRFHPLSSVMDRLWLSHHQIQHQIHNTAIAGPLKVKMVPSDQWIR